MAKALIIKELLSEFNLTVAKFEREIGVGASTIAKAIDRNSELKMDSVYKIIDKYPNVNKQWLLTGEGEMLLPTPGGNKKAVPDQERLYIEDRVEKLEQDIKQLSSLNASLRKTVQGLIEEMNELKQGVSKRVSSKSSKDAG